jgi:uncharacterized protein YciI
MHFDRYTISLLMLIKPPGAPRLDEQAAAALQDAHMSHLADLHEAGQLLAAGPLFDEDYRGLSILNVDPAEAEKLKQQDPAIRAGIYTVRSIPWMVPSGAIAFSPARFPRSMAEASRE